MDEHVSQSIPPRTLRIFSGIFILALAAAIWIVVRPFAIPLLWSIVLVSATWPLYRRLSYSMPRHPHLAALLLTCSIGIVLLFVTVVVPVKMAMELRGIVGNMASLDVGVLPEKVGRLPVVGPPLARYLQATIADPELFATLLRENSETVVNVAAIVASNVSSTMVVVLGALVGSFFLFCNGETLAGHVVTILRRALGHDVSPLLITAHETVRGAAYSVVATAIVQGALAGVGYTMVGVGAPILLSLLTMLASFVPFGPPCLYIPIALYLSLMGDVPWYYGVGLMIWGVGVVSLVDNFLRPLFISQQTQIPGVLVFVGVLGGVIAFGLLGAFLGPALIAIAHQVWLDFAEDGRLDAQM